MTINLDSDAWAGNDSDHLYANCKNCLSQIRVDGLGDEGGECGECGATFFINYQFV